MGRTILLYAVGGSIGLVAIFIVLKMLRPGKACLEAASARFLGALGRLRELSYEYHISKDEERYLREEALIQERPGGNRSKVEFYNNFTVEIKSLVANRELCLKRKVYDPVDNSQLEDPVEIVIDHPTLGIVYIMVSRRNMRQIRLIFCRGKNYYSAHRFYQIRINGAMPEGVRIVHTDDGRALVSTAFVHHLLTDQEVTIFGRFSGEVLPETVRTFPFHTDDAMNAISDGQEASDGKSQSESDLNSASGSEKEASVA